MCLCLTLCVPMTDIYVMASAYRVPHDICSVSQWRIYTSWKWHSSGHGECISVATGISKKSNYVVSIQKNPFLFENNIIKKRFTVKHAFLKSILSFNTFENLQNFHFEWNFSKQGETWMDGTIFVLIASFFPSSFFMAALTLFLRLVFLPTSRN